MKYLKSYNESIKDFLKPKSEEDIKKSLENINDDNISYILNFILNSDDWKKYITENKLKELISRLPYIDDQLSYIKDFNLYDTIYNKDEIKYIIKNDIFLDSKLDDIFNYGFSNLYTKEEIKNIVMNGLYSDGLPYSIILSIDQYDLWDYFSNDDVKQIVINIQNDYDKIISLLDYNLMKYFSKEEIIDLFNKLDEDDKKYVLNYHSNKLLDILPENIIKKYE